MAVQLSDLAYIDDTGYHYADYPTFLQWVTEGYQAIYGADVYIDPDSQDGQRMAVEAQAAYDTAALGSSVYNSFSPTSAQGTGLARLVKINGLEKESASYSTVTVTVGGTAGTVITNGVVQDTVGQKWDLPTVVTIPGGGSIDVVATAEAIGAVNAASGTITTIFTPTRGWQTVTNAAAATPGAPVEPDATLRLRQQASVADPSLTVFEGTLGGVENLTGVTKVRGYENDTDLTDGNGLPPHSICVVVAGGADDDIAQEIQIHKTPGTDTYGDVTVPVTDSRGMPLDIEFQRAVTATISVRITLAQKTGWSTDFEPLIAAAVAAVINGGEIGDDVLLTKLYGPAYLTGVGAGTYDISTIELKKNSGSFAAANVSLDFDENPVCDPNTGFTFIVT
jgi:uncharacterized phage protein gp47/JayE